MGNALEAGLGPGPSAGSLLTFGLQAREHFSSDTGYRNLNHGSFGATPRDLQKRLHYYQDLAEQRPDPFIRYDLPKLLNENRQATADLLNAPVENVVFVTNATVGINTVLRNLIWNEDGRDEILYFSSVYGACGKTVDFIVDFYGGKVSSRAISLLYPCEDEDIVRLFRQTVEQSHAEGRRAKICMFDTISSLPGVLFPFEAITRACKELGVLSLVDGAQGIGQIKLDLTALDPDFFVTNCHKWLHVPRSCAVFYVPLRNQELVPSTLPTSHGYVPKAGGRFNPLPPPAEGTSAFVHNFGFVGTIDSSAYLCVKDAIQWRKERFGGEDEIMQYCQRLATTGGQRVAEILGTKILENQQETLTRCAMVNIALPMWVQPNVKAEDVLPKTFTPASDDSVLSADEALGVGQWMLHALMKDYNTFVALFIHGDRVWVRLSAQVYLDMEDFEWIGQAMLAVCKRVARNEHKDRQTS